MQMLGELAPRLSVNEENGSYDHDSPHDDPGGMMNWRDVELLSANGAISDGDRERVLGQNAIDLFRLG